MRQIIEAGLTDGDSGSAGEGDAVLAVVDVERSKSVRSDFIWHLVDPY
jgi:hypothetical protein